ncbi:helix-turn-helix transcriptional regulator [Microbacterium trichothecenolyticum]|uniref:DNA-binding CsgD family transcriptional regulator n=1 Tax=Microbacterium trichothecenolyticum TaxID=69370 RepID=A0ABU0TWR9_MICTR|nr:LuxR family transcriptional regulator [Microbacterium trichothecenolyticum]MDQ1124106.1 DNA-binding CsgD family transcriptional regulator [Microbacterium trichothecenolyticum]
MPTSQSSVEARSLLRAASIVTATRLVPGHGNPDRRHLVLLAETEPFDPPRAWTDESARALAALFAARARRDALGLGSALISRYFDAARLTRPATISMATRSLLYSSVGEYACALGWPQVGARFGDEALLFADSDELRFYALAVGAMGHALNGEYESAAAGMASASELSHAYDWRDAIGPSYLLLLADSLVSSARMDHDRLTRVAEELAALDPDDPYLDYSARAIAVMCQLIRGEYADGIAGSWQLLHGSQRHTSQRMIRDFLACIRSDMLIAQGQYTEALLSLTTSQNPEGHGICFSMQRSASLLLLGRERDLLAETEGCVASEADHCLRTLTPVLLQRAIAFDRLGYERRAHQSMESALLLIARTGNSMTPFIMLPPQECANLVEKAVRAHPELTTTANFIYAALDRVGAPVALTPTAVELPGFTPTERALADALLSPLSLADIARERGVSPNTIKSQVRSIYLKLGVSGRSEAVEALRPLLE